MTRAEAEELADFIEGLGDCDSVRIKPSRRHGFTLIVRTVGTPPRLFTRYASAFNAYCGVIEEN